MGRKLWRASLIILLGFACGINCTQNSFSNTDDIQTRIHKKLKIFHQLAPKWVQEGGDAKIIKSKGEELDSLIKSGKIDNAEKLLDEMLIIINAPEDIPVDQDMNMRDSNDDNSLVHVRSIPDGAEIIYQHDGFIYAMDSNGKNITKTTSGKKRGYEHVAVSYDHRWIVANEQLPNPHNEPGGRSRLWLYDLRNGTEVKILSHFLTAGNGGVEWDPYGFIYFSAKEKNPFPDPKDQEEFIQNAGANDVYKIKYDGSGLKRLTDTKDRGEADVSVSENGQMITYMAQKIDPKNDRTEIWARNSDGTNPRLV